MPITPVQRQQQDLAEHAETVDEYEESNTLPEKCVDELKGRVCYFSLTGDLAVKAFGERFATSFKGQEYEEKVRDGIEERLLFAMLMFDTVVLHCSDPLRSKIVYEILKKYAQHIESGKICFVFSNSINDIRKDYEGYIKRKKDQYREGYYSKEELESLSQDFITEEHMNSVIDLLSLSKLLIRKPKDKKFQFPQLVSNDLKSSNIVTVAWANKDTEVDLKSMSLSLFQLVNLNESQGNSSKRVLPKVKEVRDIIKILRSHLDNGQTISRTAIVSAIRDKIKTTDNPRVGSLLAAITMRMDVLYCMMNSGNGLILEFHPAYENKSAYSYDAFSKYLESITKSPKFNKEIVEKILKVDEGQLQHFRQLFLTCMADAHERDRLNNEDDKDEHLRSSLRDNEVADKAIALFPSIKDIISED